MAVHNGEAFLVPAMESILNQSFSDLEFVIVDDCSTDRSFSILSEFAQRDDRVRLIQNTSRLTLPVSLNKGLQSCRADWIARMDADDISAPQRLERQWRYLAEYPATVLLGTGSTHIDHKGTKTGVTSHPVTDAEIRFWLSFRNCFVHPSVMFRREPVVEAGGYNETFWNGQDYELWSRLIGLGQVANLDEPLVYYREHDATISRNEERLRLHESMIASIHAALMSQYLEQTVSEEAAQALKGLVMSDRILTDGQIADALPLLQRYLMRCSEREDKSLFLDFRERVMKGLAAQCRFLRHRPSASRGVLLSALYRMSPGAFLRPFGLKALIAALLPGGIR